MRMAYVCVYEAYEVRTFDPERVVAASACPDERNGGQMRVYKERRIPLAGELFVSVVED